MFAFRIVTAMLAPVLLANLFYLLDTKTKFGKCPILHRQTVIGLVFGVLSCLATQFGISYNGYVLNLLSAAPLTAGLVFGGPAGLIAGTVGAVYRWFSVYWGIPAYTRVACSIATFLAGLITAFCRKYIFDRKKTSWFYGIFIALASEVFHMLLIFLTHMDDITQAFAVVKHIAVLVILANSLSVLLSLWFVALVSREGFRWQKSTRPMTQTFAVHLFVSVFVAFIATGTFTYALQKNVGELQVNELLAMNVRDVETDIADALDRDLLDRTESVAASLRTSTFFFMPQTTASEGFRQLLYNYASLHNVSEINVISPDGIITVSTNPLFDGFDMSAAPNGQASDFWEHLQADGTYVQEYRPMDYDNTVLRKYAGTTLPNGYFLQVGYDRDHFRESMQIVLENVASNRHIGQTGFLFILDPTSDKPVVSAPENTVTDASVADFVSQIASLTEEAVLSYETPDGVPYYFLKDTVEGYIVVGCIPAEEADFSRDITVYISGFMQFVVFFVLFLLVFFLLKNIIVDNIRKINGSLAAISNGNLDTRIDVRDNEEFANLSDDINTTVARLKDYIGEAEKRIDRELAFAKSIQHSALPSVFPPFPGRNEIDLYASMDTAKEVGGDFYDFYFLGRNHLAFLIADVSGKGIPAAMFMMTAKTMIKSYAESGISVSEVFTKTNEKLCESNEAGMFVTAWMGVINLKTGVVRYANAGHNPPAIRRRDGSFAFLKSRPCLVLAGMEGIQYREEEIRLEPGEQLFLYTDGVTEATNRDTRLFGDARLLETLEQNAECDAQSLCRAVKNQVDGFVGDAPQFDDITMLSLQLKKLAESEGENA